MHPFIRLTRITQPTGIWLLLWPCWWSLTLANHAPPGPKLMLLFAAGAVVMRTAGCVFNDIVDRKFDREVERTRMRPLASGEVSLTEAAVLLVLLLIVALDIAIQMKRIVLLLAAASLVLIAAYPFMKRITWWPQAFLGLTFNWGALMGWAAVTGKVELPALLLYAGGVAWTLGYDTIYAHQDKEDDLRIGVKSTALLFRENSKKWIAGFYALAVLCWLAAGAANHGGILLYAGVAGVALHFAWQVARVRLDDPVSCLRFFRSNTVAGVILFLGLWADGLREFVIHL
jgi:4-hydroxybenzoate polyprenyltransferase